MNTKKTIKIIIICLAIIGLLFSVMWFIKNNDNKKPIKNKVEIIDNITEYGYKLDSNKTDIYKSLFKELSTILKKKNVDYEEYAKVVSKMFVADFYNLDNKIHKNDVGGTGFIHPDIKINFILNAQNTIYNHLENNIYDNRKQELPIVEEIDIIEVKNQLYTYNGIVDKNAYNIKLKWTYKKDLGYQNEANIIIVKEEKRVSIVELQN